MALLLCGPVLLGDMPASGATSGGVAGVHGDHFPAGSFSLADEDREEHPHPAAAVERLNPAFDAAPLGRNAPAWSGSDLGAGGLAPVADPDVLVRDEVVLTHQRESGLVYVVEPLAAHLPCSAATLSTARRWFPARWSWRTRGNRPRVCCAAASFATAVRP